MKVFLQLILLTQLVVRPVWAQTLDESFENATSKPLTDAEQQQANNYFHSGRAQELLQAECAKIGKKHDTILGCTDESDKPGQVIKGQMGGMLEMILPKLYAVMGTAAMAGAGGRIQMGGAASEAPAPATATGQPAPAQPSAPDAAASGDEASRDNTKPDYCIYIPMGGEIIASGMQMMSERKIQQTAAQNQADAQREALYAVARTHDARSKTATIQGGIYAATAACYAVYIAQGAVIDWKMALKIGAAGLMSVIFFKKAGNHKAYANDVRAIAKKLPGAGDCNPFTQTNCFCSEPTSQTSDNANWQKVCVAADLLANAKGTNTPVPCAAFNNGQASLDAACTCKRNNTCLNGQFSTAMGQIGFGGVDIADPLRMLNEMNGSMSEANVGALGAQLNARSRRLLEQADVSGTPAKTLSKDQTDLAKEINKMGLPPRLSAYTASQQGGDATAVAPSVASVATSPAALGARRAGGVNYLSSDPGGSRRNRDAGDNSFKNPLGKQEKKSAVQVRDFSAEALAQAEITRDTSKGIFDIISNRYRNSAWTRFEMDRLVQEVPVESAAPAPAPVPAQ